MVVILEMIDKVGEVYVFLVIYVENKLNDIRSVMLLVEW